MTDELKFMLSSVSDGCIVIDKDFNITYFNPTAEEITGWKSKKAIGQKCYDLFKELKDVFFQKDRGFNEKIKSLNGEELKIGLDRNVRRILFFKTKSFKNSAYIIFNDISKSKYFDELRKDFMDSMSHELRTPISTIRAYLATLGHPKADFDKKARGEFISIMDGEAEKLSQIVNTILEASRITKDGLSVIPELLNLSRLVEDCAKETPITEKHRITVDADKNIAVLADRDQLVYAFTHLINNAVKFSPEGGEIKITINNSNEEYIVVCVEDEGIGIDFDYQERVFEAFFKVDIGTTKKIYGVGLGLYIIKKITEAHGGHLWFDSTLGKGTKFFLSIPKIVDEK